MPPGVYRKPTKCRTSEGNRASVPNSETTNIGLCREKRQRKRKRAAERIEELNLGPHACMARLREVNRRALAADRPRIGVAKPVDKLDRRAVSSPSGARTIARAGRARMKSKTGRARQTGECFASREKRLDSLLERTTDPLWSFDLRSRPHDDRRARPAGHRKFRRHFDTGIGLDRCNVTHGERPVEIPCL